MIEPPFQQVHEPPPKPTLNDKLKKLGPLGAVLIFLIAKLKVLLGLGKVLLPALKFLKLAKVLTTSGTMLLSVWVYAQWWGWYFALGFVLSIFVHEMGHVYVAWRQGLPVSAPIFIPGMGALILHRGAASTWAGAVIGIGGPVGGTIAAIACWLLFRLIGNSLFLALAYTGFLINLFNMMPIFPLDGGWITAAINPRLWLIGIIGMIIMLVAGWLRNPFIWVLLLLSIPRLWHGLRHGETLDGGVPVTKDQKLIMGASYFGLALFLAICMAETHFTPSSS